MEVDHNTFMQYLTYFQIERKDPFRLCHAKLTFNPDPTNFQLLLIKYPLDLKVTAMLTKRSPRFTNIRSTQTGN